MPKKHDAPEKVKGDSWFKATRSEAAIELIKANLNAFALAYIIAYRARWSDGFNSFQLAVGEAFLGDFISYGMTEQQYRTAKEQLKDWGFATFRTTNKGTIGKLVDTRLFSTLIVQRNGQNNRRATDGQRTGNGRVTTNRDHIESNKKREKEKTSALAPSFLNNSGKKKGPNYPDFMR